MQITKADLKLIEAVAGLKPATRKARNISLDDGQFEAFQVRCEDLELAPNRVLDALIGLFLESTDAK